MQTRNSTEPNKLNSLNYHYYLLVNKTSFDKLNIENAEKCRFYGSADWVRLLHPQKQT